MAQPAVRVVRVTLTDNAIEPRQIYIPSNYPIRFVVENKGGRKHQFAIPQAQYSLDNILPGQTREVIWTFVNVGHYEIVSCFDQDQSHGLRAELIIDALL